MSSAGLGRAADNATDKGVTNAGTGTARKSLLLQSALAVVIASLCCLTPVVLVLFGLASISTALSLDDKLYGQYGWVFRLAALVLLAVALIVYFRRRGVCTLDEARQQRNRIINVTLLTVVFAVAARIAVMFIALEYGGAAVGLPWAPPSWAFPAVGVLLVAGGLLLVIPRAFHGARKRFDGWLEPSRRIALGNGNKKSAAPIGGIFRRSLKSIDLDRLPRRDARGILNL
jgi:hypothetical protein